MPPAISRVWRHSRRCRSVRATGRGRERGGEGRPMPELPELTPESFEILVVRELRKIGRSEEHTSELQSPCNLVCRLLLEKKKKTKKWTELLEYTGHSQQ